MVPNTSTLVITPEMLRIIADIDEFKGSWKALGRISPDALTALRRIATIESIGSSTRIEGARLTDNEVEALLKGLDITAFATRDEQEVAGYAETMQLVFESYDHLSLTDNHIKQLHRDLLQYSTKDSRHRGEFKKHTNHVEAFDDSGNSLGVIFETSSPFDTPREMEDLVTWTNDQLQRGELHPLLVIGIFVVNFLAIHPFQDGNGRLSRVLTTLLLLRAGYDYVPYGSHERAIEQTKEMYYLNLRQTQTTLKSDHPDWTPWLTYFLTILQRQKATLEKKVVRERLLADDLPQLSRQILEICRDRGRVSVADVVSVTGANRNTVKDHLRSLCDARHLIQHGAGRGAWYGLE